MKKIYAYRIEVTDSQGYWRGYTRGTKLYSESPITKGEMLFKITSATKDFCKTKEGILYLSRAYSYGESDVDFLALRKYNSSFFDKYGISFTANTFAPDMICDVHYDTYYYDIHDISISISDLGLKPLNVTVEYIASSPAVAIVPDNLSLEESIEYAKSHMDLISRQSADISYSTAEINEDMCSFAIEERDESEPEY